MRKQAKETGRPVWFLPPIALKTGALARLMKRCTRRAPRLPLTGALPVVRLA